MSRWPGRARWSWPCMGGGGCHAPRPAAIRIVGCGNGRGRRAFGASSRSTRAPWFSTDLTGSSVLGLSAHGLSAHDRADVPSVSGARGPPNATPSWSSAITAGHDFRRTAPRARESPPRAGPAHEWRAYQRAIRAHLRKWILFQGGIVLRTLRRANRAQNRGRFARRAGLTGAASSRCPPPGPWRPDLLSDPGTAARTGARSSATS